MTGSLAFCNAEVCRDFAKALFYLWTLILRAFLDVDQQTQANNSQYTHRRDYLVLLGKAMLTVWVLAKERDLLLTWLLVKVKPSAMAGRRWRKLGQGAGEGTRTPASQRPTGWLAWHALLCLFGSRGQRDNHSATPARIQGVLVLSKMFSLFQNAYRDRTNERYNIASSLQIELANRT